MMMFMDAAKPSTGGCPPIVRTSSRRSSSTRRRSGQSVGVNQYVASGVPGPRGIGVYPGNNLRVKYLGRMSDGRTPTFSQTDLLLQHEFRLAGQSGCSSVSTC